MRSALSLTLLLVLVIAPMFPTFMVLTTATESVAEINDIPVSLLDSDTTANLANSDVELNTMFFTETQSSDDGLYYVARRGMDAIAYFGSSMVKYLSGGSVFTLEFTGSRDVIPKVENPTGSVTNYLLGNDPSEWKTGIEDYAILRYSEIYPGIDLVYKVHDGSLKYEFVVAPGANPNVIQMSYPDAQNLDVQNDDITVSKADTSFSDSGLWTYQQSTETVDVECAFDLHDSNTVTFEIGNYDETQELIIDPYLSFSTYLGGDLGGSVPNGIAVEHGYTYVTGETYADDFPTFKAYNSTFGGQVDCFVTKFELDGKTLVYSTFIGGSLGDHAHAIAVENEYVYITGKTRSLNFPMVNAYNSTYGGNGQYDCFLVKLETDMQSLVYSTYLGGGGSEIGWGIAVDRAYPIITGQTLSNNFPTFNAYNSTFGGNAEEDCFVTRFDRNGQFLLYSTYLGGEGEDIAYDVAVDIAGHAYVTGGTKSANFPTNGYDETFDGIQWECFVTKFSLDGTSLDYSTFLGGSHIDYGNGIAIEDGYAYVTGATFSDEFPTTTFAFDRTHNGGGEDCFVTKINLDGGSLNYSTFLGAYGIDIGKDIDVEYGYVYVTGTTSSTNFPTFNAYSSILSGGDDCFVTMFAIDGQSLLYSTFIGGSSTDEPYGISVEDGSAYITGNTGSVSYPTINAYDSNHNGLSDGFVSKLSPSDADMDSLSDWEEALLGTNPFLFDSDMDNFHDGYEDAYGSDPLDPMSYPAMPQAWYDAIYVDLDGNATLIQNLITWVDGNSTLLETVMQQLDDNATLLTQVISWLDGNHTAIETLFSALHGNATLLMTTVNALNGNSSLIQNLLAWSVGNETLLLNVIDQVNSLEVTDLTQVIAWLDGNHTAIETLFTYVEGNATLLLSTISNVNSNAAQIGILAAIISGNTAYLNSLNITHFEDFDDIQDAIDEIRSVVDELGISVGDSDYDGLDDLDEIVHGTDLLQIDTDLDNLLDSFEVKLGTDPLDDDSDGDLYLDGLEVLAGTDPLDPLSYPGSEDSGLGMTIIIVVGIGGVIGVIVVVIFLKKRRT